MLAGELSGWCGCANTETLKAELAALKKAHLEGAHKLVDLIYRVSSPRELS